MKKTLGGDRLGSGKKMQVELHGYERSTHDMGYIWRSTMSAGTLVPFMSEVALPGDTFDINLDCDIKTHPTIGPLFGSYKVQLDVFQCPMRLYQGQLHNNKLGIGMNMASVKLPQLKLFPKYIDPEVAATATIDLDNAQINPSCILSYLNIRGIAWLEGEVDPVPPRYFNAIPYLSYWDIYKNYYANKQEENGAVIHAEIQDLVETVDSITLDGDALPEAPVEGLIYMGSDSGNITLLYTGSIPYLWQILLVTTSGTTIALNEIGPIILQTPGEIQIAYNYSRWGLKIFKNWKYTNFTTLPVTEPRVEMFPLSEIDDMREAILTWTPSTAPFQVSEQDLKPYSLLLEGPDPSRQYIQNQEGLGIKTYQSDLFNNWLSTEWIDGPNGISEVTAIDTSGGSFSIDTLNLSKKVYDMLNRIAVSGGTYNDWLDAVYTHDRYVTAESPIYCGGLIKELVFQEVVSNSKAETEDGTQPLGTLAGKGIMSKKHKGGNVTIKVDEPSYIIGIISLTPRIDYSQGNKWDVHLQTMDDLHKPALDEIGFQELITEQMAWWSTNMTILGEITQLSAGKQPAWINYMTNVNQTRGNFAIPDNEMFMTLNRRYEFSSIPAILDLTTYIDPVKFNNIFAQRAIDAQNFWAQIAVDITARRKMSAKIMPNL